MAYARFLQEGLSPRVRGNPGSTTAEPKIIRSIPACAGEPPVRVNHRCLADGLSPRVRGNPLPSGGGRRNHGVYPRVCGGTQLTAISVTATQGLSPRVRGNRGRPNRDAGRGRSIPACAGEPSAITRDLAASRVYPRVCGEPVSASIADMPCGVYPRVCGGTGGSNDRTYTGAGLSPRVRGNLTLPPIEWDTDGSIPACAGEPSWCLYVRALQRVYPRVCGGTRSNSAADILTRGLSPRVRGTEHE